MSIYTDFMTPEVINIEDSGYTLAELFGDDAKHIDPNEAIYAYRLTAEGYTDATEWSYAFTVAEAVANLVDMYYQEHPYSTKELRQWFIEYGIDSAIVNRVIV